MSHAATVAMTLLRVPAITSVVGSSLALAQLPQGASYPALLVNVITEVPTGVVCAPLQGQLMSARVQVTAYAQTMQALIDLQALVETALTYQRGSFGGVQVCSIEQELQGPFDVDQTARMYSRPIDYRILFNRP